MPPSLSNRPVARCVPPAPPPTAPSHSTAWRPETTRCWAPPRNCQPAGVRRRLSENVDLDVRVNDLFDELYATTYYWNVEPQWFLGMPRSAEVALLVGF